MNAYAVVRLRNEPADHRRYGHCRADYDYQAEGWSLVVLVGTRAEAARLGKAMGARHRAALKKGVRVPTLREARGACRGMGRS